MKEIPITLLTGYLGAGKTTLLNHVLNNQSGYKVAVIVNDIGEVNIDADLIARDGIVTQQDNNLVPLQNGCICCTLKYDLIDQVVELANTGKFDYMLIEASGVCEPIPIAQTLTLIDEEDESQVRLKGLVRLDSITTVVDAKRLADEFGSGRALMREEIDEDDIENLLIQQIEFCDKVVLNKTDLVNDEEKSQIRAVINALRPNARIIETSYGKVDCAEILNTNSFDFDEAIRTTGWAEAIEEEEEPETEEYGISTFVFKARKGFNYDMFSEFAANNFPETVIRCKGSIWFTDEPDTAYIFEQSGQQITAMPYGKWLAAFPPDVQREVLSSRPDVREIWDETYGDRVVKLAFIGKGMDKEAIIKTLDSCLEDSRF